MALQEGFREGFHGLLLAKCYRGNAKPKTGNAMIAGLLGAKPSTTKNNSADNVRCLRCGALVAHLDDLRDKHKDANSLQLVEFQRMTCIHRLRIPNGTVFDLWVLQRAAISCDDLRVPGENVGSLRDPMRDQVVTWFPAHPSRLARCSNCSEWLGWSFGAIDDSQKATVPDKLASKRRISKPRMPDAETNKLQHAWLRAATPQPHQELQDSQNTASIFMTEEPDLVAVSEQPSISVEREAEVSEQPSQSASEKLVYKLQPGRNGRLSARHNLVLNGSKDPQQSAAFASHRPRSLGARPESAKEPATLVLERPASWGQRRRGASAFQECDARENFEGNGANLSENADSSLHVLRPVSARSLAPLKLANPATSTPILTLCSAGKGSSVAAPRMGAGNVWLCNFGHAIQVIFDVNDCRRHRSSELHITGGEMGEVQTCELSEVRREEGQGSIKFCAIWVPNSWGLFRLRAKPCEDALGPSATATARVEPPWDTAAAWRTDLFLHGGLHLKADVDANGGARCHFCFAVHLRDAEGRRLRCPAAMGSGGPLETSPDVERWKPHVSSSLVAEPSVKVLATNFNAHEGCINYEVELAWTPGAPRSHAVSLQVTDHGFSGPHIRRSPQLLQVEWPSEAKVVEASSSTEGISVEDLSTTSVPNLVAAGHGASEADVVESTVEPEQQNEEEVIADKGSELQVESAESEGRESGVAFDDLSLASAECEGHCRGAAFDDLSLLLSLLPDQENSFCTNSLYEPSCVNSGLSERHRSVASAAPQGSPAKQAEPSSQPSKAFQSGTKLRCLEEAQSQPKNNITQVAKTGTQPPEAPKGQPQVPSATMVLQTCDAQSNVHILKKQEKQKVMDSSTRVSHATSAPAQEVVESMVSGAVRTESVCSMGTESAQKVKESTPTALSDTTRGRKTRTDLAGTAHRPAFASVTYLQKPVPKTRTRRSKTVR